ncbi:MAG TPA: glycine dehydrogenase (aminomethyl-transferring), partial [Acidimicrobiia bacterium]|nr:glycine dehydrogenase (aminomethyl-transferring) [Acidimicrobiia bacterium]
MGFASRHIGPRPDDIDKMLAEIDAGSLADLINQTVPGSIRSRDPLALGEGLSEPETLQELAGLAARNQVLTSLIGLGFHNNHTPPVILRNVLEDPAWYTAYTPYQAEISQGR